jgi:DNA-binding NarL/FixJ family response regulator
MACAHAIDIVPGKAHRTKKKPLVLVQKVPRILLADDQREILQTVASMLEYEYQIVGLAEDGQEVLQLAETSSPDLLILDIFMPVLSGFDTAMRLRKSGSLVKILFLTVHEDPDFVNAAISLGALGYVLKPHLVTDLIPAIRGVLEGHLYVSPKIHSHCLNF